MCEHSNSNGLAACHEIGQFSHFFKTVFGGLDRSWKRHSKVFGCPHFRRNELHLKLLTSLYDNKCPKSLSKFSKKQTTILGINITLGSFSILQVSFSFLLFFFWLRGVPRGILVPQPGTKHPYPLHCKCGVLTTGPAGKSVFYSFTNVPFFFFLSFNLLFKGKHVVLFFSTLI